MITLKETDRKSAEVVELVGKTAPVHSFIIDHNIVLIPPSRGPPLTNTNFVENVELTLTVPLPPFAAQGHLPLALLVMVAALSLRVNIMVVLM